MQKKYYFNILDYTGSATRLFADRDFDGFPTKLTEEEIDKEGKTVKTDSSEQDEEEQARQSHGCHGVWLR